MLEQENARLQRAVADLTLDKLILKEAVKGMELTRLLVDTFSLWAGHCEKQLKVFTSVETGETHCQVDNLRLAHRYMYDWLKEKMK